MNQTSAVELTSLEHWDAVWSSAPRLRLPSGLNIATRNQQRLLKAHVRPGMQFLEVGCAPGKTLAWVAAILKADVAGLDYSKPGLLFARRLFQALRLSGDLRHEDLYHTTFPAGTFDVVYSTGVVEHFEDPTEIVERHVRLAKPGGLVLISIPHYGGVYGRLQRFFDSRNLDIHNLRIMRPDKFLSFAPPQLTCEARSYVAGRLSPWIVNLDRKLPGVVAKGVQALCNGMGILQPCDISWLCPLLVLELRRAAS